MQDLIQTLKHVIILCIAWFFIGQDFTPFSTYLLHEEIFLNNNSYIHNARTLQSK